MNTTTRRYSRNLNEAFGPHTSRSLYVAPEPLHKNDKIVLIAAGLAAWTLFLVMVLS